MKIYQLCKQTVMLTSMEMDLIKTGCTRLNQTDLPEIIASFYTKEEALLELSKYESDIIEYDGCCMTSYDIIEYYVQVCYEDYNEIIEYSVLTF